MADMLLSAIVPIVLRKAADSMVARIGEMWGINQQRERLHNMLLEIQNVLADAELKANSNMAVKSWLQNLKSAAYDADDLLDEFCYEERRLDAVKHGHKFGNVSDFFSLENPALFRYKMSNKLEKVVGRIDGLVVQMGRFGFVHNQIQPVANRVRTHSFVIESKVVGRDKDKNKIIKLLLEDSDSEDVKVVPVVGMGGLGKTTLARLVYNDPSVKEHFNLTVWVCISEEFNISLIVKSIIELAKGDCNVPAENMELLQRRLRHVLDDKRYLLVLDDVWNENFEMWDRLKTLLNNGDSGSAIMITTRSIQVASMMGTVKSYKLQCLDKEDSWTLFQKRAFSMGLKECQELVEIGTKIVEKCQGLPLAINTLGSLMSYKHELKDWFAVLESKVWELVSAKNEILPILKLSYDHLPSYMKQCFAFCAVFPKDYVMDIDELIQFWMAHGFIPSDGPGSLETKGRDIFKELSRRSFFQDVRLSEYNYIATCKMHDLMHDLAQSIMEGECLSLLEEPTPRNQPMINIRHISVRATPLDINKVMNNFPSLRSFIRSDRSVNRIYVRNIGFVKSNSLRIFKLHIKPIEKTVITPEKMKHLRYLQISGNDIKSVPEAISTLYLLQTLRFDCPLLERLPEGMRYMSSLRHLYIADCRYLRSMPSGFGQLGSLQTLTKYIIGTNGGNGIGELENLNLHGQLNLYNLEEVRDASDATKAKLIAKKNLDRLLLSWRMHQYYDQSSDLTVMEWKECNHFEVLDALKPCSKLEDLKILHYRGKTFPIWVTEYHMLKNLIELRLIECRWCTEIPPITELPSLRILEIKHLDNVRHLCNSVMSDEGGADTQRTLPSLEELYLFEMPNLSSWCENQTGVETSLAFPMLKWLRIINCPKLTTMPIVPLLKSLKVEGNKILSSFATGLTKVEYLSLGSHDREASTRESLSFQPWESLRSLSLKGYNSIVPIDASEGQEASVIATKCSSIRLWSCNFFLENIQSNSSLWFWKCFAFIEWLGIQDCKSLVYWPEYEFRSLNCLREIRVYDCSNFIGSQGECSSEQSITDGSLPKLQKLSILSCRKLQCLPEWLGSRTSLKYLDIYGCASLNALPLSIGGLTSLERLQIRDCRDLAHLPEGMEGLKALEKLEIEGCPKIKVLPDGLLQQLKNLDVLWIEDCPKLERHFRKRGKYRHLISEIRVAKIGEKL